MGMDEKDQGKPEEEYHFSDTEAPAILETETSVVSTKPGIMEKISRKNVIITILLIALLVVAYKVYDTGVIQKFFTKSARPSTTTTLTQTPTSAFSALTPAQPSANVAAQSTALTEVDSQMTNLTQQTTAMQSSLDRLGSQVTEMQTALSSLDARLTSLNDSVQALNTRLANQEAQLAAQQAAKQKKAVPKKKVVPRPVYFVKAMVPGRAWLITDTGNTTTVSLGDDLPGYGIVEAIDPNQGTITLSSGAVIGYNSNDI